jgi:hypothetical protein
MDVFDKLLALYAAHSTQEIEGDGALLLGHFGVGDANALSAIEGYNEAFSLVSACAKLIDDLTAENGNAEEQVRASVRMLRRMVDDGESPRKLEATRRLVEGRLYQSWPPPQQELYDRKKAILEWRDFFVSYTNRDAPYINNEFRHLIRSCLGRAPTLDDKDSNFLARVITRHLRRHEGLSGFFDEDSLQVGEHIEEGVDVYCRSAFALVQVIDSVALDRQPPKNWCFHEYCKFSGNPDLAALMGDKDRHFFILAGTDWAAIRPTNLSAAYQEWVERIEAVKGIPIAKDQRATMVRAKIKQVAQKIVALRAEIVDAWVKA